MTRETSTISPEAAFFQARLAEAGITQLEVNLFRIQIGELTYVGPLATIKSLADGGESWPAEPQGVIKAINPHVLGL